MCTTRNEISHSCDFTVFHFPTHHSSCSLLFSFRLCKRTSRSSVQILETEALKMSVVWMVWLAVWLHKTMSIHWQFWGQIHLFPCLKIFLSSVTQPSPLAFLCTSQFSGASFYLENPRFNLSSKANCLMQDFCNFPQPR